MAMISEPLFFENRMHIVKIKYCVSFQTRPPKRERANWRQARTFQYTPLTMHRFVFPLRYNHRAPPHQPPKVEWLARLSQMVLTQEEIDACRAAFQTMDRDRSGTIDVWQLRQVRAQVLVSSFSKIQRSKAHDPTCQPNSDRFLLNVYVYICTYMHRCWSRWARSPRRRSSFK